MSAGIPRRGLLRTRLLLRGLPFLLAAVLLAVIVHGITILIMPAVAARNATQLLLARATADGVHVIPPARPGDAATPFADPAAAVAICAFDLAEGPFRVRVQAGETFTSLVVLGMSGEVVHGLSDKAAVRRVLDVLIGTNAQIRQADSQDSDDRVTEEVRLRVGLRRGLVVIRGLAARAADGPAVVEGLRRTQCGTAAEN